MPLGASLGWLALGQHAASSSFDARSTCGCLQADHKLEPRISSSGRHNPFTDAAGASNEQDIRRSSSSRRNSQCKSRRSSLNLAARHQTQPSGGEPQSASSPPQMYMSASGELPAPQPRLSSDEGDGVQQSASSADRATANSLVPYRAAETALARRVLAGKPVSFTDLEKSSS